MQRRILNISILYVDIMILWIFFKLLIMFILENLEIAIIVRYEKSMTIRGNIA